MAAFNPKLLTLIREYRSLSQQDVAARSGLTQGYVSKVEHGVLVVSDDAASRLAEPERLDGRR